jgi:hypothetical protein
MNKKNIKDFHENLCANFLLKEHTIGSLRDESDFNTAVHHAKKSLLFAKDLILNVSGTKKEKAAFIDKVIKDYDKFVVDEH